MNRRSMLKGLSVLAIASVLKGRVEPDPNMVRLILPTGNGKTEPLPIYGHMGYSSARKPILAAWLDMTSK